MTRRGNRGTIDGRLTGRVPADLDVQAWPDGRRGVVALTVGAGEGELYQGPRTLVGFPPWMAPPIGGQSFYRSAAVTLGAGPVTQEIAGTVFTIPTNNVAIVRSLTLNVNNIVATSNITFRLLFNGAPVQGYDQMFVFPRVAASVSVSFTSDDTFIHVPDGARISVQVQVVDAVAYQVGADYKGWFYPKRFAGVGMLR